MRIFIGLICMVGAVFLGDVATSSLKKEEKPLVIILLGPPGAGKGTHAVPLAQTLEIPHISTGDLFREHIRNQTPLGNEAKGFIDQGKLVPDDLVLDMLFSRVSRKDCAQGFILDGFPRTLPQGRELHARLSRTHQLMVLNFTIADSFLIERITGRIVCKECGAPYHKKNSPPKTANICDRCQGNLYQREDDKEEVLRKRLEVYQIQTKPLIEFYQSQKNILQEIRADQSPSLVFEEILQGLPSRSLRV
jgi:adenylate kinase